MDRIDKIAYEMVKDNMAVKDSMASERLSGLFTEFHKWATKKVTSLPPGAPVATQILELMEEVESQIKGHMGKTGREAVEIIVNAMKGRFTKDAQPLKRLWRTYGNEFELGMWGHYASSNVVEKVAAQVMAQKTAADQYKTLNEAWYVTGNRGYLKGDTQIWYMRPDFFHYGMMGYDECEANGKLPDWRHLADTHRFLGVIHESNMDKVFDMMQGESWSPNGEGRTLVQSSGLKHTSMITGDLIVIHNQVFMVDRMGFKQLR